ncbi:MAG: glycogen debranching protein, partial [Nitrospira sp.]|nr:glycogen debranching protein [Nitrospira sp.]
RLRDRAAGAKLHLRPLFSGRDYHSLHHENSSFRFEPEGVGGGGERGAGETRLVWHPYPGLPGIMAVANGRYTHQPDWYRNFLYDEERSRGLEDTEDLASPGLFSWDLSAGEAVCVLATDKSQDKSLHLPPARCLEELREAERSRRRRFPSRLHRSADAYLVKRGKGKTIVAGYPWFTDWGRDTFIALRGICLATGRLDEARDILLQWAGTVSEGMLPNLFTDQGDQPEFNSVDASLWYVVAVHDFLQAMDEAKRKPADGDRKRLHGAIEAILSGYVKGTRFGIRLDDDGLLAAGQPGVQLTWMDAKAGDWVVTPRIGKPVEVQALWLNALKIAGASSGRWRDLFEKGRASFVERFWSEERGCLYDVVDSEHRPGVVDATFRPNQIFAVGGLPLTLLDEDQACRVVEAVEARLWTPLGLRSLAPGEPGYRPCYQGGVLERDGAYHQGTVWPWLIGPFVEAWVRVCGGTPEAKQRARARFLAPLLAHLDEAGLGHISEIADADPPHRPRGCPFQAWSLGEVLRLDAVVLAGSQDSRS